MQFSDENEQPGGKSKAKGGKKNPLNARTINGRTVEETYQKKTQLEHILLRPDTYVGTCEPITQPMWVYDESADKLVLRPVAYTPGLYKIFDEILVNAADNKQRDPAMNRLDVTIEPSDGAGAGGTLSVLNNGRGIPIAIHSEHKCYVPELIFGNLLTGSNFDDMEKKTTGGRNGYGAKLANIFSTEFTVETADGSASQRYTQTFRNNMQEKDEPLIEEYDGEDFTRVTFRPDWARFHMAGLDASTAALLGKRVYDMAACMGMAGGPRVRVTLNRRRLPVKSFRDYLGMFDGLEVPAAFGKVGERWEVGVGPSDGQFQQVSYVNSICTSKGGTHVACVADAAVAALAKAVKKRAGKDEVKAHQIKNHLTVYVNCLVENPAFDSQTKETLTTRSGDFGSKPELTAEMVKALEKSSIVDTIVSFVRFKQTQQLSRTSGKKASKLIGISKLDDANFAGTSKSRDCTLILTEGDSAKTLAVSGLGVVGRDYFGVFPLKGKLLNVRDTSMTAVSHNEEIGNIVKIMGLKYNAVYHDTRDLRYGHLMIMTDQDHDGSHIKGLLINFVHHFWPSLLRLPGFLQEFITPIVKAVRGKSEKAFYTLPEFEAWKATQPGGGRGWTTKYYKGLGTSTSKEAKEYFAAIDMHLLDFSWEDDARDANLIDMVFNKKRSEDRKVWLGTIEPGTSVDYRVQAMTYEAFINKELILYSMADTTRSIPSLVDGFKPSQRKVLFACFKRRLTSEIKVAQLAGYVSEHSAYHHGEASLNTTIIGMAQTFVGSNNVHLLTPSGQFGTRIMGGKDAASPRYIFTRLEKIARAIFHQDDDAVLTYLDDDGVGIEPTFYVPVVPMILINGCSGIGTGWSSDVPNYCPRDVVENLRRRIRGRPMVEMQPWYRGFAGQIEVKPAKKGEPSYVSQGTTRRVGDDQVLITELPLKRWTQDYKQFLESLLPGAELASAKDGKGKKGAKGAGSKGAGAPKAKRMTKAEKEAAAEAAAAGDVDPDATAEAADKAAAAGKPKFQIRDFKENHTDTTVSFLVSMAPVDLNLLEATPKGLAKFFKLEWSLSTSNMMLFDADGHIRKYSSPLEVIEEFYELRLGYYVKRKDHLLERLRAEWKRLDNKVRFIVAVVEGRLEVSNRKKADLLHELSERGYDAMPPEGKKGGAGGGSGGGSGGGGDDGGAGGASSGSSNDPASSGDDGDESSLAHGYDYLLGMKLWSLTLERVRLLEAELDSKKCELEALRATEPTDIWLRDLAAISALLDEGDAAFAKEAAQELKQRSKAQRKGGGGGRKGGGFVDSDDSDFEGKGKKKKKAGGGSGGGPSSTLPPPTEPAVSTLGRALDGTAVSAAFAAAEAAGSTYMSFRELPHICRAKEEEEVKLLRSGGDADGDAASDEAAETDADGGMVAGAGSKTKKKGTVKPKRASPPKGKKGSPSTGKEAAAPARRKKAAAVMEVSSNEDDDDTESDGASDLDVPPKLPLNLVPRTAPRRGAAAAAAETLKKAAADNGGSSDESNREDGDGSDESEEEYGGGDDSVLLPSPLPPKAKAKAVVAAKAASAPKPPKAAAAESAAAMSTKATSRAAKFAVAPVVDLATDDDDDGSDHSEPTAAPAGGRSKAKDEWDVDDDEAYMATPKKPKKPAAAKKPAATAAKKPAATAAKKPAGPKVAKAAAKAGVVAAGGGGKGVKRPAKKAATEDEDDEEEDVFSPDASPPAKRPNNPRPADAKKVVAVEVDEVSDDSPSPAKAKKPAAAKAAKPAAAKPAGAAGPAAGADARGGERRGKKVSYVESSDSDGGSGGSESEAGESDF